jgi:ABC-2 type transport system permease protein
MGARAATGMGPAPGARIGRGTGFTRGLVRKTAFLGKEITDIRRQPRLLVSLIVGPFLILFLFGVGYQATQKDISTVVVFPEDLQVSTDPARYRDAFAPPFVLAGVTKDRQQALDELAHRRVAVVVLFPPNAYQTVAQGQRAQLEGLYNEINPLQAQWLQYYSYVQTNELNKRILIEALKQANRGRGGQDAGADQTRNVAATMNNEARGLRNDITTNNAQGALRRVATLRQANAQMQQGIISSAQVLGGVALFVGAEQPQNTPQGQAITVAQNAIVDINGNLDRLQSDLQSGRITPDDARLAEQIENDTGQLVAASEQLKLIPPEVAVSPFESKPQNISPISPGFVEFYGPAVIALLIQHIAVTLTALTLVRERLLGSVELFRVSPLSAFEITGGKYLSYFLLTLTLGALLALGMHLGLGVHILAGYLIFAGVLVLLILASLSYGFFISAISNTESQAVQLSMLVLLASVFFGGFFLGLESLLPFVRVVSYMLPVTYGINALQAVMLRGEYPAYYTLGALGGIALGLFALSTLLFNLQLRRA